MALHMRGGERLISQKAWCQVQHRGGAGPRRLKFSKKRRRIETRLITTSMGRKNLYKRGAGLNQIFLPSKRKKLKSENRLPKLRQHTPSPTIRKSDEIPRGRRSRAGRTTSSRFNNTIKTSEIGGRRVNHHMSSMHVHGCLQDQEVLNS